MEAVKPAPPPPTIKTGTVISLKMFSLELQCSTISWSLPGKTGTFLTKHAGSVEEGHRCRGSRTHPAG
jgi:hypothetical protein